MGNPAIAHILGCARFSTVKMKWYFLASMAAAAAVDNFSWDEGVVLNDDSTSSAGSGSFLDSVYGPLVAAGLQKPMNYVAQNDDQEAMEAQLLSQLQEVTDFASLEVLVSQMKKNSRTNPEQVHEDRYYEKSHEAYLKYQTKLNLPADDDVSDIVYERNEFGGIVTFAAFPHFNCFDDKHLEKQIDVAIVGAPFDTGVLYRPGARFGPDAIRLAAKRLGGLTPERKFTTKNPYDLRTHNVSIVDCGDVPMTPFDNRIALNQLYRGSRKIHKHNSALGTKIITMGGDHTITLMALRSAYEKYGKVSVLHFDSHIDTWDPKVLGGDITHYMGLNHGTFLHYAAEQGYLNEGQCLHVGLRAPYIDGKYDHDHDAACGFHSITARDIDKMGIHGIINKIKSTVKDTPVYISVDIDVLDPANAPGTGTMEIGGWTGRELLSVLDGLRGINLVGADVVEVSPPYDSNSHITSLAATAVIDSYLWLLVDND